MAVTAAPARRAGERADAYLRRLERHPSYARLVSTDAVQAALREAAREAAEARRRAQVQP